MSMDLAMAPSPAVPLARIVTAPATGVRVPRLPPNLINGAGEGAGAPYTVTVDANVYTVSRNGGTFIPGMVRFLMTTEVGRTYRFRIFNPVPSPAPPTEFSMRKSDDAAGFANSVNSAALQGTLEFTATATTTYVGISPTSNVTGVLQFERPECRLAA